MTTMGSRRKDKDRRPSGRAPPSGHRGSSDTEARRRNAQAFAISGGITLCFLARLVWTGLSHYQDHGDFGLDITASVMVVGFGAIAFFTGRSWWRNRPRPPKPPGRTGPKRP